MTLAERVCSCKADGYSHLLQPLDGWGGIPHCFTRQHDVPHPGGGYRPVEGQNPSRSCKSAHVLHQSNTADTSTTKCFVFVRFSHSLSSLTSSLTEPKLQAHRAESEGVSLSPSEEERTSITWTSDKMCMSCKSLQALTPRHQGGYQHMQSAYQLSPSMLTLTGPNAELFTFS